MKVGFDKEERERRREEEKKKEEWNKDQFVGITCVMLRLNDPCTFQLHKLIDITPFPHTPFLLKLIWYSVNLNAKHLINLSFLPSLVLLFISSIEVAFQRTSLAVGTFTWPLTKVSRWDDPRSKIYPRFTRFTCDLPTTKIPGCSLCEQYLEWVALRRRMPWSSLFAALIDTHPIPHWLFSQTFQSRASAPKLYCTSKLSGKFLKISKSRILFARQVGSFL